MASSSSSESKIATAKTILSTAASIAATAMVVRSFAQDYLPDEIHSYFFSNIRKFFNRFSSEITLVIDEFDGLINNQIYEAAEVYLATIPSSNTRRLKVSKPEKEKNITIAVDRDEEIVDVFEGSKFKWMLICRESRNYHNPRDINSTLKSEIRSFELTFHKKHKQKVLDSYLPHILKRSRSTKQEKKTLKIFTVDPELMYGNFADVWTSVNLDHPSNFDTLAMDLKLKELVMKDLERFVKRKEFYRKVGKAWKRGYLLYGPPGTGKSSLIAAMANYLNFDIYDLELTELRSNSELRRLLVATANRSILVVEDIDCTIELQDRMAEARAAAQPPGFRSEKQPQVTLSGLLNFIDGLWSSCGDERIIIFTTNHKEKLDPALLRPGRMDVHIHMSFCTPCGFKQLATNYLGITEHALFERIEELIQFIEITPAEVAEQLLKSDEHEVVLEGLIEFLKVKQRENEEAKAKKAEQDAKDKERESSQEGEKVKENGEVKREEIKGLLVELKKNGKVESEEIKGDN